MKTCMKLKSRLVAVATLLLVASTGTSHAGLVLNGRGLELVEEGGIFDRGNLSSRGAEFATPSLANPAHTIPHLNDRTYGNGTSWLADGVNANGHAFAGISFGETLTTVNSIAFGRDNLGGFSDRTLGLYTLQYTQVANPETNLNLADNNNPALGWTTIGTLDYQSAGGTDFTAPHLRHRYNFNRVSATAVRLVVPDSSGFTSGTCIDEIEVYYFPITYAYEANDPGTTGWFASTDPVSGDLAESATVTLVQGTAHFVTGPLTNLTDGSGGTGATETSFFTYSEVGTGFEVDKFKLSWDSNQDIARVVTFSWQDYDFDDRRFPQIYTLYGSTATDPATDDDTLGDGATWDLLATVDSTTVYPYSGDGTPPVDPEQLAVTITGDGGGALGSYRHLLIRATMAGTNGQSTFWSEFDVIAVPLLSLGYDGSALDFSWNSQSGKVYDLLSALDLSTAPASWSVYQTYQDIAASGTGTNTLDDVPLDGTVRFFAIAERTPTRTWSKRADGFASVNALGQNGTTGGAGGETVTVTTRAELEEYAGKEEPYIIRVQGSIDMSAGQGEWVYEVNVASDKTIIGVGRDAELVNGGLSISSFAEPGGGSYDDWVELGVHYGDHYPRAHNVIIRNLTIHSAGDGLTIDNAHHIWIDQCHFHNNVDGCIDSRFDTTFLTVSWCVFSDHHKTFGIGWTPNLTAHITLHHNWFRGTVSRNPSGDNILRAHCYNNYLSGVVSGHHSRGRTNMIVQNCLFENAGNPLMLDDGTLVETGCIFRGTTGRRETRGPAFFDPADFYEFTLDKTEELPAIISKNAGPQEEIAR